MDHIILNGRPGGGKSELIDFLKGVPLAERQRRFGLGAFDEIDDFPLLWQRFIEDDRWQQLGEPRRYSKRVGDGYVQLEGDKLLDLLILELQAKIDRDYLSRPDWYADHTLFVEFSRGTPDGGYARAYSLLSRALWQRAAIVYIAVSYEESVRRNEARYQAALADSILAHKLPDESQARFSKQQDFEALSGGASSGYLQLQGVAVPFVSITNQPELTDPVALATRYGPAMQRLAELDAARP